MEFVIIGLFTTVTIISTVCVCLIATNKKDWRQNYMSRLNDGRF